MLTVCPIHPLKRLDFWSNLPSVFDRMLGATPEGGRILALCLLFTISWCWTFRTMPHIIHELLIEKEDLLFFRNKSRVTWSDEENRELAELFNKYKDLEVGGFIFGATEFRYLLYLYLMSITVRGSVGKQARRFQVLTMRCNKKTHFAKSAATYVMFNRSLTKGSSITSWSIW